MSTPAEKMRRRLVKAEERLEKVLSAVQEADSLIARMAEAPDRKPGFGDDDYMDREVGLSDGNYFVPMERAKLTTPVSVEMSSDREGVLIKTPDAFAEQLSPQMATALAARLLLHVRMSREYDGSDRWEDHEATVVSQLISRTELDRLREAEAATEGLRQDLTEYVAKAMASQQEVDRLTTELETAKARPNKGEKRKLKAEVEFLKDERSHLYESYYMIPKRPISDDLEAWVHLEASGDFVKFNETWLSPDRAKDIACKLVQLAALVEAGPAKLPEVPEHFGAKVRTTDGNEWVYLGRGGECDWLAIQNILWCSTEYIREHLQEVLYVPEETSPKTTTEG
jgi:hypothetical protein